MPDPSPGSVLRDLQRVQAQMKKSRQLLAELRGASISPEQRQAAFKAGWASLTATHRLLGSLAVGSLNDEVLTKQLAAERYATALLVRLRRLQRGADMGVDDEAGLDDL